MRGVWCCSFRAEVSAPAIAIGPFCGDAGGTADGSGDATSVPVLFGARSPSPSPGTGTTAGREDGLMPASSGEGGAGVGGMVGLGGGISEEGFSGRSRAVPGSEGSSGGSWGATVGRGGSPEGGSGGGDSDGLRGFSGAAVPRPTSSGASVPGMLAGAAGGTDTRGPIGRVGLSSPVGPSTDGSTVAARASRNGGVQSGVRRENARPR